MTQHDLPGKRLIKICQLLKKTGCPYHSNVFELLLQKFDLWVNDTTECEPDFYHIFLVLLFENYRFSRLMNNKRIDINSIITNYETGMTKDLIRRYLRYVELKSTVREEKIFSVIAKEEYEKDPTTPLKTCQNRLRQWKLKHKELLIREIKPALYQDTVQKEWKPLTQDEIKKARLNSFFIILRFLMHYDANLKCLLKSPLEKLETCLQENDDQCAVHTLARIICWIALYSVFRLRLMTEFYEEYKERLKYAGLLLSIVDHKKAGMMTCIVEGRRYKSKDNRPDKAADIFRAMVLPYRDVSDFSEISLWDIANDMKTMRNIYPVLLSESMGALSKGILEQSETESFNFKNHLENHLKKHMNRVHKPALIKNWTGVISLLQQYDTGEIKQNKKILSGIFAVCSLQNGWEKQFLETNGILHMTLRHYFELWQDRGFFDDLYKLLSPHAKIKQLENIRWHQVNLPNKYSTAVNPPEIIKVYSPFWSKETK